MATYPQTQADYVAGLTDDDFLNGGHRTNFPLSLVAVLAFIDYSKLTADELVILAAQVATDAASAAAGSGTEASVANIRAVADVAHYVSMRRVVAANAPVALTRASTTAWDMDTGINFDLVLDGDVTTIANPTNQEAGKSGLLRVKQDATGGRTIGAWGSNFTWIGGMPDIPAGANAVLVVPYLVWAAGTIYLTNGGASE